jgi:hypothetical protein
MTFWWWKKRRIFSRNSPRGVNGSTTFSKKVSQGSNPCGGSMQEFKLCIDCQLKHRFGYGINRTIDQCDFCGQVKDVGLTWKNFDELHPIPAMVIGIIIAGVLLGGLWLLMTYGRPL